MKSFKYHVRQATSLLLTAYVRALSTFPFPEKKAAPRAAADALLAMLAWMFLAGLGSPAARGQSPGDFKYTIEGGTVTITGLSASFSGPLTIPEKIAGLPVTRIEDGAFRGRSEFYRATIPDSVISIGRDAFAGCWMTSVSIGASVKSIGEGAFRFSHLASVTIPNSVTSLGAGAFAYCGSLTSIAVGESNSEYSSLAGVLFNKSQTTVIQFPGNKAGSYVIPNTVTRIEASAFFNCTALTSVSIGDSVTSIGERAFNFCSSLTGIEVDGSNPEYSALAGVLFNKSQTTLIQCPGAKTGGYAIPNTVTSIVSAAFGGATLTSVTIPSSVAGIGEKAFEGSYLLISITVDASNPEYGSVSGVLFNKSRTTLIKFPEGKAGSFSIPNTVTRIGDSAFATCQRLTSVSIPTSVIAIGDSAFAGCSALTGVSIPSSVLSIGNEAFFSSGLRSVTIASGVTRIGYKAFSNCGLASVTIPNSVISIGKEAFSYCYQLTADASGFFGLTSVSIGNGVTSIGERAFYGCFLLTSISVGASNPEYSSVAGVLFNKSQTTLIHYPGNKTGESYVVPNTVTNIGESAFSYSRRLASVTIPNSVISIGNEAFYSCYFLSTVTIPDSVISIGNETFAGCSTLTSVIIPSSVSSIGTEAFARCSPLTSVFFQGNAPLAGASIFLDSPVTVFYLPGTLGWGATFAGRPTALATPPDPGILGTLPLAGTAPLVSYAGDPGGIGNPTSWRTSEFLGDWGQRAIGAEYAYAAGYAGEGMNVGVVDSGTEQGLSLEHGTRFRSVPASGGSTPITQGWQNWEYNDSHGTLVSGTIGATRDGRSPMHGVAFKASVYVGNTRKRDGVFFGEPPAGDILDQIPDNAYIANVYRAIASASTANSKPIRTIHSSWGSAPPTENYNTLAGLTAAWRFVSRPEGWMRGALDVARSGTAILSFSAANAGVANPSPRAAATYFMPELEGKWYAVGAIDKAGQTFDWDGGIVIPGATFYNRAGVARWAFVTAPGNNILSTDRDVNSYSNYGGTSAAGPHAAATLALIMQRFPYMSNEQALYTMFTTALQNATINNPANPDPSANDPVPNPSAGQVVAAPDPRNGWGTVNLRNAMRGPGQFIGVFNLDTRGYDDTWSLNISDSAIKARKIEDDAEAADWETTKIARGWTAGLPAGASGIDRADYQIGMARQVARENRANAGSLIKTGPGALTLTGANSYSGGATISGSTAGALIAAAPRALGTGDVKALGGVLATRTRSSVLIGGGLTVQEPGVLDLGIYQDSPRILDIAGHSSLGGLLDISVLSELPRGNYLFDLARFTGGYEGRFAGYRFHGLEALAYQFEFLYTADSLQLNLQINGPLPQPVALSLRTLPGGQIELRADGKSGQRIRVETSNDLFIWTLLAGGTVGDSGWIQTVPMNGTASFFRAVSE